MTGLEGLTNSFDSLPKAQQEILRPMLATLERHMLPEETILPVLQKKLYKLAAR